MIKCTTELIPYGIDEWSKVISNLYIANIGENENGTYNYVAVYYEAPSDFTKGVNKYCIIKNYDRNQSMFNMYKDLFSQWTTWMEEDDFLEIAEEKYPKATWCVKIFKDRLKIA